MAMNHSSEKSTIKECGIHFSETNITKVNLNSKKNSRSLSSNLVTNLLKHHNTNDKSKTNDKKVKKNKNRGSFYIKSHKFNMSVIKGNNFLKRINNSSLGEKESSNLENTLQKVSLKKNNSSNKDMFKKKKKKKEMVMISHNMRQNSQNLKNPELFYSGLFSTIIQKQRKSFKPLLSPKMKKKNKTLNSKQK